MKNHIHVPCLYYVIHLETIYFVSHFQVMPYHVREGNAIIWNNQSHTKGSLVSRFIPAGEAAAGICGLKLGDSRVPFLSRHPVWIWVELSQPENPYIWQLFVIPVCTIWKASHELCQYVIRRKLWYGGICILPRLVHSTYMKFQICETGVWVIMGADLTSYLRKQPLLSTDLPLTSSPVADKT